MSDDGWFTRGETTAAGAVAGGMIGAGVGLLVGALRKKRVVVYEAR
jgi:hypothetical protein